jgi:CD2 antigen cytoplasmic tail-binding protein 2
MPLATNGAPQELKAVRFSTSTNGAGTAKRSLPEQDNGDLFDDEQPPARYSRRHKRPRSDRPNANEDELDDVDDWKADDEQGDEDEDAGVVPSEHELLEAKRARRFKRQGGEAGDDTDTDTRINNTTSLAGEGIAIEPFDMKKEREDGSGFFDGDTYIFRKHDPDDEPDAWLDSLSNSKEVFAEKARSEDDSSSKESTNDMDALSPQELYAKIIPLVSDTETVMQSLVRYGNLLKRKPFKRNNGKTKTIAKDHTTSSSGSPVDDAAAIEAAKMAQTALNDVTEAANALLLQGQVDIYQKTRNDLIQLLPDDGGVGVGGIADDDQQESSDKPIVQAQWEYEGSQDKQIHGPYTTPQMKGWIQAGYFVGPTAVKVRTVCEKEKSLQEDLLADLMEGDDDDEEDNGSNKERGEWMVSDQVDFNRYS